MSNKITEKIRLWGIVQGVGFRPFVAKTADRLGMKGQVLNIGGLVEITVTDTEARIDDFVSELQTQKPVPAEVVHIKRERPGFREFQGFSIMHSSEGDEEAAMIPADLAVCPNCLEEMRDPSNKRFEHPFISCMVCGPRYTITDRFPYDRENTSMEDFPMCGECREEYTSLDDRRYHAQTISCHECGPYLKCRIAGDSSGAVSKAMRDTKDPKNSKFSEKDSQTEYIDRNDGREILELAAGLLKEGKVIAFKSMGGYNLMADPFNDEAVAKLRTVKKREKKPFAVMFQSIDEIKKYCFMNEAEERLIASSARPIMLLERRVQTGGELDRSRFIGSFLPSMGAQYLLLEKFGRPLIATSANLSSMPIIKEDSEMFELQKREPLISAVIYNDRKIRVSVDDSVVRIIDGQPQIIRRSKGYAPVPLYIAGGKKQIFATGGQLKNSFALSKGPFAYVSQFFGDMDSRENQILYENNVERMSEMFRIRPQSVVCDMHPLYYTTSYGQEYAQKHKLPILEVQHHHAHVASVMAEHSLEESVIGVSFDGTGYGTDGAIWGGEFLLCRGGSFERKVHLKYVGMLGGDSSMKEGWKSAFCYGYAQDSGTFKNLAGDEFAVDLSDIFEYAREHDTLRNHEQDRTLVCKALENNINSIRSSSMGRMFDSVAALLGICDYNSYEGQCAIMLEDAAARAQSLSGNRGDSGKGESRAQSCAEAASVSETRCSRSGHTDEETAAETADMLALRFHKAVAQTILEQCFRIRKDTKVSKVALTGGVFQNKILMEETLGLLRKEGFEPYYNISVSPNDGGIALGQLYVAAHS